jgi:Mg-chelatase subunit ChlD
MKTIGDEALEARIVAWILGEASAFEASELEARCANDPDAALFARRMRLLDGLIAENATPEADPEWRLPEAKRRKVLEAIGEPGDGANAAGRLGPGRKKRAPRRWRRGLLAAAAVLLLLLAIGGMMAPMGGGFGFESATRDHDAPTIVNYAGGDVAASERADDDRRRSGSGTPPSDKAPANQIVGGGLRSGDGAITRKSTESLLDPPESTSEVERLPSPAAPSTSATGVIASNTAKPEPVPVPEMEVGRQTFFNFGKDNDFGAGWGEVSEGQGAEGGAKEGGFDGLTHYQPDSIGEANAGEDAGREREIQARSNPALTAEHAKSVDRVRENLHQAEGNYDLGEFDEAEAHYEDVLRIDPGNRAARRGMERITSAKSDYYRAAYDHTRAELLTEVDEAWERAVPAEGEPKREPDEIREAKPEEESVRAQEDLVKEKRKALTRIIGNELVIDNPKEETGSPDEPVNRLSEREQQKQTLDLMAEVSASEEAFSTFSLNVSDASFRLAAAALRRGERPQSVRPEEFYNAFDYGDPLPAAGEPVAGVIEQAAHPAVGQRNLMRIALRTGAAGRLPTRPLHLTLLVDHSGSMERPDRAEGVRRAVAGLASLLKEGDRVSVVGFARRPRLLAEAIDGADAAKLVETVGQVPAEGGTNLEEALELGGELARRNYRADAQNRLVLFTDGAANLGDADPESLNRRIETLRQQGIAFDAAGFGAEHLNDDLLERLTRNGDGRYYVVDDPETAGDDFAARLAGAFRPAAENVKVQVVFNPQRVGRYKLIGFEDHRLEKEDFRDDSVDAAEMAPEEAGVALYQFEPMPGGEGEIGEVRVRFRDVARDEMVERSWTIRYDPQAPAFDRAPPGLRLAGLAAFAAARLRDDPMARWIDFDALAQVRAEIRRHYAGSDRVETLEWMIREIAR